MTAHARVVLLASFLLPATVFAQAIADDIQEQAIALRDGAMQNSIAYDVVESLTMEVGPRPAGSAGDAAAVRWAIDKLNELGFKNVHADEVLVPHWDRGTLDLRITAPTPNSWSQRRLAAVREHLPKASRPRL